MRKKCIDQVSIFDLFSNHEIGRELQAMSARLDRQRDLLDWVAMDLHRQDVHDTGRQGLPAEAVLRCALLKQYRQLSYQELAFHLSDSASFQAFARLPLNLFPRKSVLQKTISGIQPATWERINQRLLADSKEEKVELGKKIRIDSTVTETTIHAPTDSGLLRVQAAPAARLAARLARFAAVLVRSLDSHRALAAHLLHHVRAEQCAADPDFVARPQAQVRRARLSPCLAVVERNDDFTVTAFLQLRYGRAE